MMGTALICSRYAAKTSPRGSQGITAALVLNVK